jgi:DNA repair exonuclease SbcCD nuclease subunit
MKTLLLTDLHLSNKSFKGVSLLEPQVNCILDIVEEEKPHEIIIMGDVFMNRSPSPSALLALKDIIKKATLYASKIVILRGNHDSETKADDGITALSVFDNSHLPSRACLVTVIDHAMVDHDQKRVYIPHYENVATILHWLRSSPKGYTIFGHFGFVGCLNSTGDKDFDISLNEFNNKTYLGHIHKHSISWNDENQITVLGTPYTTNFGEQGKLCIYGVQDEHGESFYFKDVNSGPQHLAVSYKNLIGHFDIYKKLINESKYSTLLRVNVEKDDTIDDFLIDQLEVVYIDFKFLPVEELKEFDQSEYQPQRELFTINDQIIEDYVDKHNTSLDKEEIMWGLDLLKDEDR